MDGHKRIGRPLEAKRRRKKEEDELKEKRIHKFKKKRRRRMGPIWCLSLNKRVEHANRWKRKKVGEREE